VPLFVKHVSLIYVSIYEDLLLDSSLVHKIEFYESLCTSVTVCFVQMSFYNNYGITVS